MNKYLKLQIKTWLAVLVIILSFGYASWQMIYLAKNQSATTDEKVHIPAGFSYWKYKNYYLNPEHPPLAKLLVGLPVYLENPNFSPTQELFQTASSFYYDSWQEARGWGESLLLYSSNDLSKILFSARMVNIVLTLVLILFLTFWSYQIGSWTAAALTALLSSFFPLFLAHGSLANTDLLITLDFALLCYFWWKYLKEKKGKWFIISSVVFAVCAVTKFSFVAFIPVLFLTSLFTAIKEKKVAFWPAIVKGLIMTVITWLVIMAFYGFSFSHAPDFTGAVQLHEALTPTAIRIINLIGQTMVPALYFKGLFMVLGGAIDGRGVYILGHHVSGGIWYYFPLTIIFKTPIGLLALLVGALCSLKKFLKKDYTLQVVLLGASLVYLLVAMISKTNLGQRHIMPIYPLLIIFISQLVFVAKKQWQIVLIVLAVLAIVFSTVFNFRNQIAYFNEFTGGVKNGYKILLDSNYDWGQSLPAIAQYINKNKGSKDIYLQYQWKTPWEENYYDFYAPDLKSFDPTKDSIIIIDPGSYEMSKYAWTRKFPIIDRIADTLFVLQYNANADMIDR